MELRLRLTSSTDISFGVALRAPRKRGRRRSSLRRWGVAIATAACCVLAATAPVATVVAARDLERLGALALAVPEAPALVRRAHDPSRRAMVAARRALSTAVRGDPPGLMFHVVAHGETLLSIAARYGITPQTLAYNNAIQNSADLVVGQSLIVPPLDAAAYFVRDGETLSEIATRFAVEPDTLRALNSVAFEPEDITTGRLLFIPMPDGRYPGFRLRFSEAPRVLAPRIRLPTEGILTQLFSPAHNGVDIAAPYGSPVVASDSGTVTAVGWRGTGGLAVCVLHDWGLETCDYHLSRVYVELGERVVAGERIAAVGSTGLSTGAHVHWEARTNGVLVDPMTYAPDSLARTKVGGAIGSP